MKRELAAAKTEELKDEVRQSFYGRVGHQVKTFFPSDRRDLTVWNKIKHKYPLPEKKAGSQSSYHISISNQSG